jgi:hypothetical protein
MKTTVVNKSKENFDIYIGRGSLYGNPYVIGVDGNRDQVIHRYREWFNFLLRDPQFVTEVRKLEGKKLGCFCSPQPCHGDVIAEWLNNTFDHEETDYEESGLIPAVQEVAPDPVLESLPEPEPLTEEEIFAREAAQFNDAYAFYEKNVAPEPIPDVPSRPALPKAAPKVVAKPVEGPDTL